MIDLRGKRIIICGDIHGEFRELVFKLTDKGIDNSAVIVVGDCGFGFEKPNYYRNNIYNRIIRKLTKSNIDLYFIRGNHDNPDYFNGDQIINLPRFKTISDYSILLTDFGNILCIGGATSIDKELRVPFESWWEGERPLKKNMDELPRNINIILSHEGPIEFDPVVYRNEQMSLETYQMIIKDRSYLGTVLKELSPKHWLFGHYHKNLSGSWGDTLWHCLGITELYEILS